jgi:hypothetical protein
MGRTKITSGLLIAAFAAAGLWSSLHQIAQIRASAHGHDSLVVLLAPHHAFTVLGPLTPLLLLVTAAMRARHSGKSWLPSIGARELVGSCVLLEGAELASGSMAHSWLVTSVLLLAAMAVSILLALLAVKVVQLVTSRIGRSRRSHEGPDVLPVWLRGRVDVTHPSRVWLARRSRRGPPALLPVAV